jgi:CMP-N-acetylneuraminic acid synthetase
MSTIPRVVAVIPARAGSKGIPGKNLRTVGGRPLVARAVDSALAATSIDHVVVSTDGDDIADAARAAGASVVRRPAAIAGDEASSESALLHALDELAADGVHPEVLVFLQATSPFIDPEDLDDAVGRVLAGLDDVVFAATPSHAFLWRTGPDGTAIAVNHDAARRPRRQDREPEFRETGAFYAMRTAVFRAARHRFAGRVGIAVVDPRTAIDVDDLRDLEHAEVLAASGADAADAPAPTPSTAPIGAS